MAALESTAHSQDVTDAPSLHAFSQAIADLTERAGRSLVLPHPTRVPVTGVVWTDDRVLTAAHAMGGNDEGKVILPSGEHAAARIVGRDPTLDLALLEVVGARPGPLAWAENSEVRAGELCLAVGVAGLVREVEGERRVDVIPTVTVGAVNYVAGAWRTRGGATVERLIEIDASLTTGASGGVLVSSDGRLLGLNTHGLRHGGATLPVETLRLAVPRLEQGETVKAGWLGIGVQPARVTEADGGGEDDEQRHRAGVLINAVRAGSPAETGGLLVGDVLLTIDAEPVSSYRALRSILLGRGGQTVHVVLHRGGQPVELDLEVGVREGGGPGFGVGWGRGRHRRRRGAGPWAN